MTENDDGQSPINITKERLYFSWPIVAAVGAVAIACAVWSSQIINRLDRIEHTLSGQWTRQDMEYWTTVLRASNTTINVPDIPRRN